MAVKRGARVLGPYEQDKGWRVIVVDESGDRQTRMFENDIDATRFADAARAQLAQHGAVPGMVRPKMRDSGKVWQAYGRANGKQVYVGTYATQEEADLALIKHHVASTSPTGRPVRLRVTAIYGNSAERELTPFPVTEDGLTGFEIDGEEYVAFIAPIKEQAAEQHDALPAKHVWAQEIGNELTPDRCPRKDDGDPWKCAGRSWQCTAFCGRTLINGRIAVSCNEMSSDESLPF